MHPEVRGPRLESFLLPELGAFLHYEHLEYPIAYWRPHGGNDVDFVIRTKGWLVAIVVKTGNRWDSRRQGEVWQGR